MQGIADSVPCRVMVLPSDMQADAARVAVEVNPQNAPSLPELGFGLMSLVDVLPPEKLSVLTGKKWGTKVRLGVSFAPGTSAAVKQMVLQYANKWGAHGDIKFSESAQGEIRLAFENSGYWSYLGTDILNIPKNQQTMNLQGFDRGMSAAEWDRVVPHEFGHTLGFPHEHERAEINARLDREKVIAEFMRTQGWSRQDVIDQIFSPPAPGSIMASAVADERSIMCYSFPGRLTLNGQPIPGGTTIDAIDAQFVGKVYPLAVSPPPPPPVEPPAGLLALPVAAGQAVQINSADVVAGLRAAGFTVTKQGA